MTGNKKGSSFLNLICFFIDTMTRRRNKTSQIWLSQINSAILTAWIWIFPLLIKTVCAINIYNNMRLILREYEFYRTIIIIINNNIVIILTPSDFLFSTFILKLFVISFLELYKLLCFFKNENKRRIYKYLYVWKGSLVVLILIIIYEKKV